MPRCVCRCESIMIRVPSFVQYAEWARRVRTRSFTYQVCRILLLDSSIDLTGDGDDGVLLDPIIFGPFSRSYASLFNKTSRLRSLDGFNTKIQKLILFIPFPDRYIRILCNVYFVFLVCIVALRKYLLAGVFTGWLLTFRSQLFVNYMCITV